MNREDLLTELEKIDPDAAHRARDSRGPRRSGRPYTKRPAVLAAVWCAVMEERFFRSYGHGRRGKIPSVKQACEIVAARGRTRNEGGGGIRIRYQDGREVRLQRPETIRRYFNDAWDAAEQGDEFVLQRMRATIDAVKAELTP